jgi:proteasome accessory factor C
MAESSAAGRARRLLALLPFLSEQRLVPLSELAAAVGTDEATVAEDLTVLSLCGGDERDPGQLIGVYVEGDTAEVFADLPALGRPVRLTPAEARALTAALESIGVDPRSALLARLARYAERGVDPEAVARTVRAAFAQDGQASVIAALDVASQRGVVAVIRYASAHSGLESVRRVHPLALHLWRDGWYLVADCESAGEQRTFRVDRITSVSLTREPFERPDGTETVVSPLPEFDALPRATVIFDADEPDLNDRDWPGATFERGEDGVVTASVPYAGSAWLARKVAARLGTARIVEPQDLRAAVVREAQRMLDEADGVTGAVGGR